MAWEIVVIWAIVIATLVWFHRDERRIKAERLAHRARYFATAPAYRYEIAVSAQPAAAPQARAHRRYLDLLQQTRSARKNSSQTRL